MPNLIKEPGYLKKPGKPLSIDWLLANRPGSFKNTVTLETGISDFCIMVVPVLKYRRKKQKPKIIQYRNYKDFNNGLLKN